MNPSAQQQAAPKTLEDHANIFTTKVGFAINEAQIPASMIVGLLQMVIIDVHARVIQMAASVPSQVEMKVAMEATEKLLNGASDDKIQ